MRITVVTVPTHPRTWPSVIPAAIPAPEHPAWQLDDLPLSVEVTG